MNIGIDVDGVLVNLAAYQLIYGEKFFQKNYNMQIKNPKAYDIVDIFECSKPQREKFWTRYIWGYCLKEPMTIGASDCMKKLREAGHKIYVITGRVHTTEKGITGALFRWMLKHWLKKNHFYYDEMLFCSEKDSSTDKYEICMKKNIDVMVDDKVENLLALKDTIRVFCYPAPWNEDCRELDKCRINGFEELYLKL